MRDEQKAIQKEKRSLGGSLCAVVIGIYNVFGIGEDWHHGKKPVMDRYTCSSCLNPFLRPCDLCKGLLKKSIPICVSKDGEHAMPSMEHDGMQPMQAEA